nr:PREDICTED: uncharacterized protein LOC109033018 [Bemisia tabaci]
MRLTTSFLILLSCWGLTMEELQPTPNTYLYSDVDACTRYNFLPINEKNFREAILFFNLCQQLIHVLPAEQRKDYARYLRHELIMTRNEFKSKNENKDIAQWLEKKIDSLLLDIDKQQSDAGNDHALVSSAFQLPFSRFHLWRKGGPKRTDTQRQTLRTNDGGSISKPPEYEDIDQDDLLSEERISLNDVALIGLILGLVSTVSAAFTLLYICYCGNKRKKKTALCNNRQKQKDDDDDSPIDKQCSRSAVGSQVSTKIAKYSSGECKVNKSEGCVTQYQASDPNSLLRTGGQDVQKTNTITDYGENTGEARPQYEEVHENLQWNADIIPEVEAIAYRMNMEEIQPANNVIAQYTSGTPNELGHIVDDRKLSHSLIMDQLQSGHKTIPMTELNASTERKEGYGDYDEQKQSLSVITQQNIGNRRFSDNLMDSKKPENLSFIPEDAKSGLPLSYAQQKYSKGQVPLMDPHFPCDVRQQSRLYTQQMSASLQPTAEQSQTLQLKKDLQAIQQESNEASSMTELFHAGKKNVDENQEASKCVKCNKNKKLGKKRLNFTCENESAMMRSKLGTSRKPSALDKPPMPCPMTESENIMHQEKFLCSLSATTPLTMKEQYYKIDSKAPDKKEMLERDYPNQRGTENVNLQIKDDLCGDAQSLMKKSNIASADIHHTDTEMQKIGEHQRLLNRSFQNTVSKKRHRQKVAHHPRSPLTNDKPVDENNSSYYSVKPGSPYQSCAEVDPLFSTKEFGIPEGIQQRADFEGVQKTNNTFTSKTQKIVKTVFRRYDSKVRDGDEEKLINR